MSQCVFYLPLIGHDDRGELPAKLPVQRHCRLVEGPVAHGRATLLGKLLCYGPEPIGDVAVRI